MPERAMIETLMRQWLMLRSIPRHPHRIDPQGIRGRLQAQGCEVSVRTIQRDLNKLARAFPLEFDGAKPQGWFWRKNAMQFDVPGMDAHTALTFTLAKIHLQRLLPAATVEQMQPWFAAAARVMDAQPTPFARWPAKLRVIAATPGKVVASVDPAIQATVYDGLLLGRQIEVTYRAITTGEPPKTYPIHPLGLVLREQAMYVACTAKNYAMPRFLALHRIESAHLLDARVRTPKGFDLDTLIEREMGIPLGTQPVRLLLRVRGLLRRYLAESPIEPNQTMRVLDAEWSELRAAVPDTVQTRNWIRMLGADAMVVAPVSLRREVTAEAEEIIRSYAQIVR